MLALRVVAMLIALGIAGLGCGSDAESPQQLIRRTLEAIEAAVEDKDLPRVMDFISERYDDGSERSREDMEKILGDYFVRPLRIRVLSRIQKLQLRSMQSADVVIMAGLARGELLTLDALRQSNATVYRFETQMEQEADGVWRLVRSRWRRAEPGDFL